MSVNPGFGGQQFIPNTFRKLDALRELRQRLGAHFLIEVDGGVSHANAKALVEGGADVLVAGNSVFSAGAPEKAIAELYAQ
jgi:ribulose-phosphate 3-epimerase